MESPLYRRNPESTQLGRRILATAAELYVRHGLEWITFRKLAVAMDSTEASLYRYFHNKYQLLCYLVWRYWRGVRQELERWNRELPPGSREAQLLLTLLPGQGHELLSEHLHRLVPTFWSWYQTRSEQDEAICEPVLTEYDAVVTQTLAALSDAPASSDETSARLQQARMLCQSASCLALFEVLPDYDVSTYRQLWSQLLKNPDGLSQPAQLPMPPLPAASRNGDGPRPEVHAEPLSEAEPVPQPETRPVTSAQAAALPEVPSDPLEPEAYELDLDAPFEPDAQPDAQPDSHSEPQATQSDIEALPQPEAEPSAPAEIRPEALHVLRVREHSEPILQVVARADAPRAVASPAALGADTTEIRHAVTAEIPPGPPVTHVMVRKRSGYNLLELQDFMALPPAEQRQLLLAHRLHFISGEGQPIAVQTAIKQLYPAGLKQ